MLRPAPVIQILNVRLTHGHYAAFVTRLYMYEVSSRHFLTHPGTLKAANGLKLSNECVHNEYAAQLRHTDSNDEPGL